MNRNKQLPEILILIIFFHFLISCQAGSDGSNLLYYTKTNGKLKKIRNSVQWQFRYKQILDSMMVVMGPLPDASKKTAPGMQIIEDSVIGNVRRLKVSYAPESNDLVPAYLLMPVVITNPVPGILCLHQTTEIGKGEPAGVGGSPNLDYAYELAKRGYVALAPDYPNFGDYEFDPYSHGYLSATMKGIWNHISAIDLLQALPEVDPDRIACIGHSLGGHNTLFLSAFDKRIKVAVSSCGFTSFYKYYGGDLSGWSHKGYMPRIATIYGSDPRKMPFDFAEIIAAIAPRAIFINAPLHDSNFDVSGVHDCVNEALQVYRLFDAENKVILKNPDAPHDFPPAEREEAYLFIDREFSMNKK